MSLGPDDPVTLFLNACSLFSQETAVEEVESIVTYGELQHRVSRLAQRVLDEAPHRDPRIAILLPQGAWAYASMLASLWVGGIYAPLNVSDPPARISRALAAFRPHVVLKGAAISAHKFQGDEATCWVDIETLGDSCLSQPLPAGDLAYVMFTSGSTGNPKGVAVARSGLAHFLRYALSSIDPERSSRWSQHANIGFDLSVFDIFGALCSGGTLVPVMSAAHRIFPGAFVRDNAVTIWTSVPSAIDVMSRSGALNDGSLASLRTMVFCGEPLLKHHVENLFQAYPGTSVFNAYGPTEATVFVSIVRLNKANFGQHCLDSVALGSPIGHMNLHLSGPNAPHEGQIIISGPQVAKGYWRDRSGDVGEDSGFSVHSHFFGQFVTGDWAKMHNEDLFFVGRTDRQVKRRGYRIELNEIDEAVRNSGAVGAYSVLHEGKIVTVIEGSEEQLPSLRRKMRGLLPAKYLPDLITALPEFPKTSNDKIDTLKIASIAQAAIASSIQKREAT